MARIVHTGTRIRDRRVDVGMRQTDLAQKVGISASYLNLIEHNRRRIAGKLLSDIASILDVDPALLAEETETAVLTALRTAAESINDTEAEPELDRVEEFARRYPGWAETIRLLQARFEAMEQTINILSDRLAHDPNLSATLHEILSTATAILSSADILTGPDEIDPTWQTRFLMNIQEEAQRLSDGAQELVGFLDNAPDAERGLISAQHELENWLAKQGFHIADLEDGGDPEAVLNDIPLTTVSARTHALNYLQQYAKDARVLPMSVLLDAAEKSGWDPARIAMDMGAEIERVMRRLATLPASKTKGGIGRISCDGAGAITFRKPVAGFDAPRFVGACPIWPLFHALSQPMTPISRLVEQSANVPQPYSALAYAHQTSPHGFGGPVVVSADMILLPTPLISVPGAALKVGQTCRICSRNECAARREASIVGHSES